MKIVFLGTNGWYDTETGNTICTLVQTNEYNIIFDAGNGIHKVDRYIDWSKPAFLFLGHFHVDHIEGFHILAKFRFAKGLTKDPRFGAFIHGVRVLAEQAQRAIAAGRV